MKELKFERKGKTIRNIQTGEVKQFGSNNKAKRESRRLQSTLGDGTLRVI